MKKISIVIPTYNHCDDLLKPCIESILKYTDLTDIEIVVVANGCTDGTQAYLEELRIKYYSEQLFPYIWFDEGMGYTKSTNEGIRHATGEFIILLNNDTVLLEQAKNQWIDLLTEPFKDPKVGITGPMRTWCPSAQRNFLIFFCVCTKRNVISDIGILDEAFAPGYGEDTDFCCKLEDAGYKMVQVPPSNQYYAEKRMVGGFPIFHKGNVSFKNWPGGEDLIAKNNKLLEDRHSIKIARALKCDGFMHEGELRWLAKEAKKRKVIIEVGSWHGRSTRVLGDNACGIVYAVDHFNGSKAETNWAHASAKLENGDHAFMEFCDNNLDLMQTGKVVAIRGSSVSMSKMLKKNGVKADMIFIDAGHTYEEVCEDIDCWKDLLADDGLFCGHDFGAWAGVTQAVKEKFSRAYVADKTTIWHCEKKDIQSKTIVFDCFPFNNEFEILEKRFVELYDTVDRFVIVEATRTHGNKPKPLYFRDNLTRFNKYLNKVTHIVVDDYPATDPWSIERHQRDAIMRGLTDCRDTDVVIISDCDEIPKADAVKSYKPGMGILSFEMDLYYYSLQTMAVDKWLEAKILPYGLLKKMSPCGARYTKCGKIPVGGWHFSYFGGIDSIIKKIEDTAHQEYNKDEFKDPERIRKAIEDGTDLFGRGLGFKKL